MHVRTLGASEITVGDDAISPDSPTAFTSLFLLAIADPKPVARAALAVELWPSSDDRARNHRLRTLLHRLRRRGAPLCCESTTVRLAERPVIDYRAYLTRARSVDDVRARVAALGGVLPGLEALRASGRAERLDEIHDVIVATVMQWLGGALVLAKGAGDWPLVEQLARRARDLDDQSELGWLSLAEAECLTSHQRALETVDEYLALGGDRHDGGRLAALELRRRIVAASRRSEAEPPLIGRADIMRRIWAAVGRAQRSRGGALLLWGPAGIGKTRLLREVENAAQLTRSRVILVSTRSRHTLEPLGVLRDLTVRLLDESGAAGCDPLAYRRLRQFVADGESENDKSVLAPEALFLAVTELLGAVADETSIIIALDDLHTLGGDLWPLLRALFHWSAERRVLWLLAFRALASRELSGVPEPTLLSRVPITALHADAARALLAALPPERAWDDEHTILTCGGNPLLLRAAASPFDRALADRAEAAIEDTLARLTPVTVAALCEAADTIDGDALDTESLRDLETAGIVRRVGDRLELYGCWARAVLQLPCYPTSSPPISAAMIAF